MQFKDHLIRLGERFDGHDCTMIVAHHLEVIVVFIVHQMSHDRATIGPRSRIDRGS